MANYQTEAQLFKTLGNPTRLHILDMLSCGEICACDILDGLTISQSTLSHHMRVLIQADIVIARKDATWVYYSIIPKRIAELHAILDAILLPKQNCVCEVNRPEDEK